MHPGPTGALGPANQPTAHNWPEPVSFSARCNPPCADKTLVCRARPARPLDPPASPSSHPSHARPARYSLQIAMRQWRRIKLRAAAAGHKRSTSPSNSRALPTPSLQSIIRRSTRDNASLSRRRWRAQHTPPAASSATPPAAMLRPPLRVLTAILRSRVTSVWKSKQASINDSPCAHYLFEGSPRQSWDWEWTWLGITFNPLRVSLPFQQWDDVAGEACNCACRRHYGEFRVVSSFFGRRLRTTNICFLVSFLSLLQAFEALELLILAVHSCLLTVLSFHEPLLLLTYEPYYLQINYAKNNMFVVDVFDESNSQHSHCYNCPAY
jgi:hypothetical protein